MPDLLCPWSSFNYFIQKSHYFTFQNVTWKLRGVIHLVRHASDVGFGFILCLGEGGLGLGQCYITN